MSLAWLITLTSTMIVLHIIVNKSNNCLLFAEQLQAVHITFYTFMLSQHVKKQLGFVRMQYQQYFLVIKTKAPLLDRNTCARWTGEAINSCKQAILQFLCTSFVPIKYNVLFLLKMYSNSNNKNVFYIGLSAEALVKKVHNR